MSEAKTIGTVLLGVVVLAFAGGYITGVERATPSVVDVNLADRETPTGEVEYDCSDGVCDVTVTVEEWRNYETLAVEDLNTAETYYLHPGNESVTIEDVAKHKYDEVAVYVPVRELTASDVVWYEYFDDADGDRQSFGGEVERDYTVGVDSSDVR
ncbi:hypothetical protein [Halopenitus persicus]|uniref:hypothetical protein n=1 Tax=Halopenitus persicus TaxID=1048396 RepID=UPI0012FD30E7|nr:hypothetical protein [Halopenitus persicus]